MVISDQESSLLKENRLVVKKSREREARVFLNEL